MIELDKPMAVGWARLAAMVVVSTAVMFILMYQLVYSSDHIYLSVNRLLSSFIMGSIMVAIMLGFMWEMYRPRMLKLAVLWGAIGFALTLFALNRSQAFIGDIAFMEAMVPHHSIALNNGRKSHITDPRVRRLADGIIKTQVKEIEEMKILIADIKRHGSRGTARLPPIPAVVTPEMSGDIAKAVQ